jgi:hypothetical protein
MEGRRQGKAARRAKFSKDESALHLTGRGIAPCGMRGTFGA